MPPPRPPPAAFAGPSALVSRTGSSSSASSFPYPPRLKLQSEEARREADQRAFMAEIERLFGTADGPGFVAAGSAPIQQQQQQQDEQESERQQWATMPAPTSLDPTAPWATGTEVPALVRSALSFYPPPPPPDISPTPPTPGTDFSQYLTFASPPASQPPDVVFQDEPTAFDVALQEWVAAGKVPERLPTVVRDELVDMSLRFRRQVALIISPEELVASLDRPEDKRPHPGLLWAMVRRSLPSSSPRPDLSNLTATIPHPPCSSPTARDTTPPPSSTRSRRTSSGTPRPSSRTASAVTTA